MAVLHQNFRSAIRLQPRRAFLVPGTNSAASFAIWTCNVRATAMGGLINFIR
jgi:hypothetical protein